MKKTTKKIPLVINRERWVRGEHAVTNLNGYDTLVPGNPALLNSQGNMCCLGFACKALGATKKDMLDMGMPSSVRHGLPRVEKIFCNEGGNDKQGGNDKHLAVQAQGANDDDCSEAEREVRVKKHLTKLGFKVTFTGQKGVVRDKHRHLVSLKTGKRI